MLQLLRHRCESATPDSAQRLRTQQANALTLPLDATYDLIVTHFFLDCLTQPELDSLVPRIANHLQPGALWLLSDFHIPANLAKLPARLLVRALYLAFRILTNLRTTALPDHTTSLQQSGLTCIAYHHRLAASSPPNSGVGKPTATKLLAAAKRPPRMCHPERSLSQFHRERRSRRACPELAEGTCISS